MSRYIFIHGHFYQPPRENPWLEEIELQESARPYNNWNERITAECYAPNVASRILGEKGDIVDIVNNYSKISFNFGPTLLTWLERFEPDVYLAILKADKSSQHYFSGHGGAMAQAYNHMILPLANGRDKQTQVLWGIRDFEFRFKRKPEGMWLPETAVDVATLEVLAAHGIKFVILAPYQAKRIRRIGEKSWHSTESVAFDIQQPYSCPLPSGRQIAVFFYDGPISHDIAFAGILNNGEHFARRLVDALRGDGKSRYICCATDGETYGHHHRFGNMALSYCLHYIGSCRAARLAVPGLILDKLPIEAEVEIKENSSWSCVHGVERWREDCGCCIGTGPHWNQKWRRPLREAMDGLRDRLAPLYEETMSRFFKDPWGVRDAYIEVVLDRSRENVDAFFRRHAAKNLSSADKVTALKMLEMQRQAMFMYTSCGWFFDDISGIETVQIIQYAARAMQLARETTGRDLEPEFLKILAKAPGNTREWPNGAVIYQKKVKPQVIDLLNVGAHFAIASLFEEYPKSASIYSYTVDTEGYQRYEIDRQKLAVSKARIRSVITGEEQTVDFSVLLFGDYSLHGCVRPFIDDTHFRKMHGQIKDSFFKKEVPLVIYQMNEYFSGRTYSLWNLFKNEQAKVLRQIFNNTLESVETHFREIYRQYYPLMQINPEFLIPVPQVLSMTVEFVLICDLAIILQADTVNIDDLARLVGEIKRWRFMRGNKTVAFKANDKIDSLMQEFARNSKSNNLLIQLCEVLRIFEQLGMDFDFWKSQNIYFSIARRLPAMMKKRARAGDKKGQEWVTHFDLLGKYLKMKA